MTETRDGKVSIIPLGGIGEIGKNMFVIRYRDDIIVIDSGLMFPEEEMLGVDFVIPDITYLKENQDKIRGIFITHGHEDHIGALPYVLKELSVPVYGPRLALALVEARLKERNQRFPVEPTCVTAGQIVKCGPFEVEFIHVNHSISDVLAMAVTTPAGIIIHTADFKFDQTPIDGATTDYHKFAEYGAKGVLVLLSDSTNAERPGYTLSERQVGEAFDDTFRTAPGRIVVATFASNIHRIQQVIDAAHHHGRKVCLLGRSMVNVAKIASDLGYLTIPDGTLVPEEELNRHDDSRMVLLSTGSQGEPMAALSRMAMGSHRSVAIKRGDTVIISASPIPGNEKSVAANINRLFKLGAEVIYEAFSGVHVSGHASQEELKLMMNLTRPRYFMPIHGEYRHLVKHARLARELGIPEDRIFIAEIGSVLEFDSKSGVVAGQVQSGTVLVDGLGVGDVGNVVLRDRRQLSQDGIVVVIVAVDKATGSMLGTPEVITRGFVYVRESEEFIEAAREYLKRVLVQRRGSKAGADWQVLKGVIKDSLASYFYEKTQREPMILPAVVEV
jgi:ribonuclease J